MVLRFTTLDKQGRLRNYSWWFSTLDYSLDVLSSVSLKGNQIVKAELLDNNECLELPVDAFDGNILSKSMQALEDQWLQLLSEPMNGGYVPVEPD